MFEFMGYSVLTAESGEEALEVLQSIAVDAVVVDYEMPGMDGEETARQIRKMCRDLPIILSSGFCSLPQHVLETVSASVPKTMRSEVLIDMLERLQLMPADKGAHEIAMQLDRSIPA
jgi:CheY-like chemotaxis protein